MYKEEISKLTNELVSLLGIEASISVEEEDAPDATKSYHVNIDSPKEAGLLIGAHGSTLHAIQSFLAMAIKQKTGDWLRIVVDIGDWRQKHEDQLAALARQTAERAKQTGEDQYLYNLAPSQRRVVHLALSKEDGVVTESVGEGSSRYLVVKPA